MRRARSARAGAARYLALDDLQRAARRHLPRMLYDFIAGGAETEASVRANRDSFAHYALLPRVLVDTSQRTAGVELFGQRHAAPVGIAPLGAAALAAYRGDLELARGAAQAGVPMILSASSLIRLEEVAQAGARWFQAYLPGDPARIEALLARVQAAGFRVLVLTADVPVLGRRESDLRNGFSLPVLHFENMDAQRGPPILSGNLVRELGQRDRLTWEHLRLMRRLWKGPLVVKGVLSIEDALRAHDCGADGLILSNHGGRQLDGAIAPLHVLAQLAARLPESVLMLDGGIRRGTDVLKALALGARFVFAGRPFLYAAALGGAALVADSVQLLTQEIELDMALMGVNDLRELGATHVAAVPAAAR
jgi:L-lactate dehydrogenase (cytochrome)